LFEIITRPYGSAGTTPQPNARFPFIGPTGGRDDYGLSLEEGNDFA
jgi:hypothetical protein